MGLFNKINEKPEKDSSDEEDTIDASELLAINQEAARKEKLARQALMDKSDRDDEEIGIEFEATTTIQNIGDLLEQIKEPSSEQTSGAVNQLPSQATNPDATVTGITVPHQSIQTGVNTKDHVDEVIQLKEKILKMKFEQRFQNQQFKEQIFKLLTPFERSKNQNIRNHIKKIKMVIHEFTKDKE